MDEDSDDMCRYCGFLRQRGYDVCCFSSYAEGVACLEHDPVDLVVVSQGSPAFEGWSLLERAIEKDRHTPVVVLTRSLDMHCYPEAMQLGAFDYLKKPIGARELLKLVAAHIRSES